MTLSIAGSWGPVTSSCVLGADVQFKSALTLDNYTACGVGWRELPETLVVGPTEKLQKERALLQKTLGHYVHILKDLKSFIVILLMENMTGMKISSSPSSSSGIKRKLCTVVHLQNKQNKKIE